MLRAIRSAEAVGSQRIVPTVLAAHTVPPEAADADAYIEQCVDEILPEVDEWGLAQHADVFCERGAFDVDQSRRYLEKAKELGLELRLHGDQFSEIGAIPLAVELGARSVDHLEATGPEGVAALAASDVDRRDAARRVARARPADAAGARADRRGRRRRARDRLQPGLELLRLAAARDVARLREDGHDPGRGARRLHGQRGRTCSARAIASGACASATRRTSCCSTRPTGATSPTTSATRR